MLPEHGAHGREPSLRSFNSSLTTVPEVASRRRHRSSTSEAVKAAITMEQVLGTTVSWTEFERSGGQPLGSYYIHKGSKASAVPGAIVSKNVWNCFSRWRLHGGCLDFISRLDNVTIHAAATKAIEWFGLDREAMSAVRGRRRSQEGEAETH